MLSGVLEHCKITNPKHQITNKSQIPIFKDKNRFGILNFGHCDLFDICDLLFGIFRDFSAPSLQYTSGEYELYRYSRNLR